MRELTAHLREALLSQRGRNYKKISDNTASGAPRRAPLLGWLALGACGRHGTEAGGCPHGRVYTSGRQET